MLYCVVLCRVVLFWVGFDCVVLGWVVLCWVGLCCVVWCVVWCAVGIVCATVLLCPCDVRCVCTAGHVGMLCCYFPRDDCCVGVMYVLLV